MNFKVIEILKIIFAILAIIFCVFFALNFSISYFVLAWAYYMFIIVLQMLEDMWGKK